MIFFMIFNFFSKNLIKSWNFQEILKKIEFGHKFPGSSQFRDKFLIIAAIMSDICLQVSVITETCASWEPHRGSPIAGRIRSDSHLYKNTRLKTWSYSETVMDTLFLFCCLRPRPKQKNKEGDVSVFLEHAFKAMEATPNDALIP